MKKILKNMKSNAIFSAVLTALYGLVLTIWPDTSAKTLCYVIAGVVIAVGIGYVIQYIRKDVAKDFYRKDLVYGLFAITLGIIGLVKVEMVESIIPVVLGIFVLFSGISKLQNAFDMYRLKQSNWLVILIIAVLNVIFAIILITEPVWVVGMLFRLIGIGLLFSGITDLVTMLFFTSKISSERDDIID